MPFYRVEVTDPFGEIYEKVVEADSIGQARVKALQGTESGTKTGIPREIQDAAASPEKVAGTTYERPEEYKDVQFTQTDVAPSFTDFINPDLLDPVITDYVKDGFVTPYESTFQPWGGGGGKPLYSLLLNGDEGDEDDEDKFLFEDDEGLDVSGESLVHEKEKKEEIDDEEFAQPGGLTFEDRARALEAMDPFGFASFVEGLQGTRYGDALSGAGPYSAFLRRQVDPLRQAYIGSELFPMIGGDYIGESGEDVDRLNRNLGLTENQQVWRATTDFRDAYNAYLRNPNILNDPTIDEETGKTKGSLLRDVLSEGGFKPDTFAGFTRTALGADRGVSDVQRDLLSQFRRAAGADYSQATPIAQSFLRPETEEQANVVSRLAQQAMGARYSPIILGALGQGMNLGNVWSDYTRQAIPQAGQPVGHSTFQPSNFFDFLGNRMGLL